MAEKWIQGAIKRPGALREKMGVKAGEKIPKGEVRSKISALKKEGEGDKKLSAAKRMLLKQLVLARTLGEMKK
jgi:hypothetical protein